MFGKTTENKTLLEKPKCIWTSTARKVVKLHKLHLNADIEAICKAKASRKLKQEES